MDKLELVLITVTEYEELLKNKVTLDFFMEDVSWDELEDRDIDYSEVQEKIDKMKIITIDPEEMKNNE